MSVEEQGVSGAKIFAKTRRGAAKLYGLILHHCGKLRALGDRPCVVQVEEVGNSTSRQSFRSWFAGDKIYVECFIPGRRVNKYCLWLFLYLTYNIVSLRWMILTILLCEFGVSHILLLCLNVKSCFFIF